MNLKNISNLVLTFGLSLFYLTYFQKSALADYFDKTDFCNNYAEKRSYPKFLSFNNNFNLCMKNYRQLKRESKKSQKIWDEYEKESRRLYEERLQSIERERKDLEQNMENLFR